MSKKKNHYHEHQKLIKNFLLEAQPLFPNLRFFSRHVGLFYTKYGKPVKINKKGMFDVWAIGINASQLCQHLEFEFKTGESYKSKDQKDWGSFLDSMNCHHFEVRENNFKEVFSKMKKALS